MSRIYEKTELNVNKNRPQDMAVSSSVEVNDYQFKSCILCQKSGLLITGVLGRKFSRGLNLNGGLRRLKPLKRP